MKLTDCIKWQQQNKYTPESIIVYVYGEKLKLDGTMIQEHLFCGQLEKAEIEIKRLWRKQNRKERPRAYYYYTEDKSRKLWIPSPFMLLYSRHTLQDRYKRYKDMKKVFSEMNWQTPESTIATLNGLHQVEEVKKNISEN